MRGPVKCSLILENNVSASFGYDMATVTDKYGLIISLCKSVDTAT